MKHFPQEAIEIMNERFHHDTLISLATSEGTIPWVRTVNAYYEEGSFYVITHAKSNKMQQITKNSMVAVCGDWFTAHGIAEDMGYILDKANQMLMGKLRAAFCEWYDNGHIDENDTDMHILRIQLTDGVLFSNGTKYVLDFSDIK
ncbi:MAG: pyridoxamine 5'-phosphate oxidase family protein [Ruminococcaceae bacterium]|nr:pyridoxamine 5'-phosphate oxidase family protein [Oscillospiraceae bacterium]